MNQNVKLDKSEEVEIHALSHDGRGIATFNQKKILISGALPEEKVTYKLLKKHRQYDEGEVLSVLKKAAMRTNPPCEHFGLCGGCSLQHMNMESQLQFKLDTLLSHLKHFGKVEAKEILPPINAVNLGYRRKARLGVKFVTKKNKLLVGFREKSSRYLADLTSCSVLHPAVGEKLTALSKLIASLKQFNVIPQIEVAIGNHEVALIFRHLEPLPTDDLEKLIDFAKQSSIQIYLQPNSPLPITKLWPQDQVERLTYTLPDYQLEYLFHPLDFTQINLEVNRLMVKQAISLLDLKKEDHVLDLFCGIGNFTLPMAHFASRITGVEGNIEMTLRARENARHNHIKNTTFYATNLMNPSVEMTGMNNTWMHTEYNKILLDPPRAGAQEIIPYFKKFKAQKIVYVSCNPATLARDAGELVHQYGYQLQQIGVMNMFPHTSHIEAMAAFEKN